jgi:hypothetical protein
MGNNLDTELKSMILEEAVNEGQYETVKKLSSEYGLNSEETSQLVALSQIKWLNNGRGNFTSEGISIWNSQDIKNYLLFDSSTNTLQKPIIGSLSFGSKEKSIDTLIHAMSETIGYHVEMDDSKGYSPGRRAAIDLFLSDEMEQTIKKSDIPTSEKKGITGYSKSMELAKLIGTSYHCIFVTGAMDIIPLSDFQNYVRGMEKWKSHLAEMVQADIREKGEDSWTFRGFGEFDLTIGYLDLKTKEDFNRLREVVDSAIVTAKEVYGGINKVSKQVGDWLSYIPDDNAKQYIRRNLIDSHSLDEKILDENTTPTEVFLKNRFDHILNGVMNGQNYTWFEALAKIVQTREEKEIIAGTILDRLKSASRDYDLSVVKKMVPYGNQLYNEQIVSNGIKQVCVSALEKRDINKLKIIVPLMKDLYKGDDMPDLKALPLL